MSLSEANKVRILYFLVFCCTAAWLPILADYCKEQGLSPIRTSIILNLTPLLMFLVQPFYGMLADRLGYKKTMLYSSLFAGFCYGLYLFHGGFLYLFVITVFMALFYNTLQPVLDSLSLQLVKNNPAFSYGTLRIAGAAGWAFTSMINGQLIDTWNTTVIFAVSAISMLLTFAFAFTLSGEKAKTTIVADQQFKNARVVIADRTLLFLLFCVFLVSMGGSTIWYFYSSYMKENGASASLVGYGLSLQGICELPFFYFSARIIGKIGIRLTLVLTVISLALRLFLYSITRNPYLALPIELLHGVSWSLFWVACVEYVDKLVDERWRATGQSLLYASYFGVGTIVGNFWTGYLSGIKMKIGEVFLLNAGIVLAVALLIFLFMRTKKEHIKSTLLPGN